MCGSGSWRSSQSTPSAERGDAQRRGRGPGRRTRIDADHVRDLDALAALQLDQQVGADVARADDRGGDLLGTHVPGECRPARRSFYGRCSTQRNARLADVPTAPPKSVLGRALTLLTAFRPGDAELTLAELARRTGLPKPTAHRMLAELAQWNVVERTPGGIRLGMRLFELGQLAPLQRGLREAATPFLSDLFEATHETVHLAVPDGLDVVYVQKLAGRNGPRIPSRIGGRMPAYCTGVGKALLAFAPPERLAAVVAGGLGTPHTAHRRRPGAAGRGARPGSRARVWPRSTRSRWSGIACVAAPGPRRRLARRRRDLDHRVGQPPGHRPPRPRRPHRRAGALARPARGRHDPALPQSRRPRRTSHP